MKKTNELFGATRQEFLHKLNESLFGVGDRIGRRHGQGRHGAFRFRNFGSSHNACGALASADADAAAAVLAVAIVEKTLELSVLGVNG